MAITQSNARIRGAQHLLRTVFGLLVAIPAIWLPVSYFVSLAGEPIHWQDFMVLAIPALLLPMAILLFTYRPPLVAEKASLKNIDAANPKRWTQSISGFGQMLLYSGLGALVLQATPSAFLPKAIAGLLVIAIALGLYYWSNNRG